MTGTLDLVLAQPSMAPARAPYLLPKAWRVRDLLFGFGLLVAAFVAIGLVLAVFFGDSDGDLPGAIATAAFELVLGAIVALLAWWRRISPRALGFVRPSRAGPFVAAWLGSYVVIGLYQGVLVLVQRVGADTSHLDEGNPIPINVGESRLVLVVLGVAVVVFAPVCEELFFRAFIYRGLRGFWRMGLALAVSGALFAAFHINLSVLLPYTLVGMLFAWAYEDSGSLWSSIGAHAAVNSLAFVMLIAGAER